eukprot:XP_022281502.1 collagen alpha-1(III) chain-like [Canis lupus familiaris]
MQKAKIDTLQLELGARPQRLGSSKAQNCSQGEHRPSTEGQQNRVAETAELRSFALTGSFAVNWGGGRRGPGIIPAAGRARQPGSQRRGHPAGAADHERPPGRHSEGAHPAGLDPGASAAAPAGGPRCRLSNRAVAAPARPGPGHPLPPAASAPPASPCEMMLQVPLSGGRALPGPSPLPTPQRCPGPSEGLLCSGKALPRWQGKFPPTVERNPWPRVTVLCSAL